MPLTPVTISAFQGLKLQANSFSQVPDGSFEVANNVVVSNDGILRKRRGFSLLTAAASMTSPKALVEYRSALLVSHNNTLAQVNTSSGGLTALSGTLTPPASGKPRFATASGNLYATSASGVRKVESLAAAILPAGIPPGLDLSLSLPSVASAPGKTGPMQPNASVGYRVLFGRRDANNLKVVGAPSELTTISNSFVSTSASYSGAPGTTITITSASHGLATSDTVVIANATDSNLNGEWSITVTGANTYTVTTTTSVASNGTCSWGVYKSPQVEFSVPAGLTTEHFYQLYRTTITSDAAVSPSDDGRLVQESNLTSAQVSAGKVTVSDDVEDLFLGADLYTNPNQSGVALANYEPPLASDVCSFKNCLFYADVETKHELTINLVSVVAGSLDAGDFVEITSGGTTHRYVATTSAPASEGGSAASTPNTATTWDYGGTNASGHVYFRLTNSSPTTLASAIARTAKSLAKAINRHSAGLVYAYYVSGPDDVPGAIRLVRRSYSSSFSVKANDAGAGDCFSPDLWNSNAGQTSTNSDLPATVFFSKPGEPEAVPLVYSLQVGSSTSAIQRIIPLRDSILVLKSDGLWRISGEGPSSFSVTLIDSTIPCVANNSAVALSNQVFYLSSQGVVAATETSASVMSRDIEALIAPILGSASAHTNAVGYESERLYVLSTIQPGSTSADIVYVLNTVTNAWTTWDVTFGDGHVFSGDDRLYMLDSDSELLKERKSQNQLDYCERSFSVTADTVDVDAHEAQFIGSATIEVNDVIVKAGEEIIHRVTGVDATTSPPTITFSTPPSFDASDACVLYKPIASLVKTTPLTLGDATVWKQYSDVRLAFRNRGSASRLTFTFEGDARSTADTVWEAAEVGRGWGVGPWGEEWGGPSIQTVYTTQGSQTARVYVPLEASRGTYLQTTIAHERAAESFEIQSLSVTARPYGHRVTR